MIDRSAGWALLTEFTPSESLRKRVRFSTRAVFAGVATDVGLAR